MTCYQPDYEWERYKARVELLLRAKRAEEKQRAAMIELFRLRFCEPWRN